MVSMQLILSLTAPQKAIAILGISSHPMTAVAHDHHAQPPRFGALNDIVIRPKVECPPPLPTPGVKPENCGNMPCLRKKRGRHVDCHSPAMAYFLLLHLEVFVTETVRMSPISLLICADTTW